MVSQDGSVKERETERARERARERMLEGRMRHIEIARRGTVASNAVGQSKRQRDTIYI